MRGSESDEALALRAQNGDEEAREQLLRRHLNAVRACARGFFLADGETDDLVQEGTIGLWNAIATYRQAEGKSFKNFAYLCVRRRILDAVKRSACLKNVPLNTAVSLFDPDLAELAAEADPEATLLNEEEKEEFRIKLMKQLSDFEFRVVTMYLDGMSYMRICEATGRELKSVDNALARAKRKLTGSWQ